MLQKGNVASVRDTDGKVVVRVSFDQQDTSLDVDSRLLQLHKPSDISELIEYPPEDILAVL